MVENPYSCTVALLIAQLTFRGMPLAQGMRLARLVRLHGISEKEVHSLLGAVMDLPISVLPEKQISLGKHTFLSAGEMVGHLIALGLSKKFGAEKIGGLIHITAWMLREELEPQQTVAIWSDAIQSTPINGVPSLYGTSG